MPISTLHYSAKYDIFIFVRKRSTRGPGRVSRSETEAGHSALAVILEEQLHPVMRAIVGEADRRRITLAQLSRLTGRDPDALKRSFRTRRPQLATVEALTTALSLRPITARALLHVLSDRDECELIAEVWYEATAHRAIFANPGLLSQALGEALVAPSLAKRREALAAFEVARSGLSDDDTLHDTAPAPALVALCNALGFELKPFLAPEVTLEARVLEAAAALDWLLDSLPLSEREKNSLEKLITRYKVDPTRLVFRGALARAKDEFRRTVGREYSYLDALAIGITGENQ